MKYRTLYVALAMFALITGGALSGFSQAWESMGDSDETPTPEISGVIQANAFSALPIVAAQKGYFEEEGVSVTLKQKASGKVALAAFLAGEADFATASGVPIVQASFERDDFAVFATIGYTDSAISIVARRDSGIKEPRDLVGKSIATQRFSAVHFFLDMFLAFYGVEPSEINYLFLEPDQLVQAVVRGNADALAMRAPYSLRAKEALGVNGIMFADAKIYRQYFNLVAQKKFLQDRAEEAMAVLRALIRADDFVREDPETAKRLVIDFLGAERESEILAAWPDYRFGVYLRQSLLLSLEGEARWLQQKRQTESGHTINYLDFIHTAALQSVAPFSTAIRR